jgi:DNA polymerase zeta
VLYGDTDSMFVHLPGRSRAQAFRIGAEIAAAVTAANPKPVKLQLEKARAQRCICWLAALTRLGCTQVYEPCILVTKKRYVGMAYASATCDKPVFDAKGIETVRRDTCGLVAKTMERSLRLLFATHDLGVVRKYLERQWTKVLSGRMSVQDAVFAREVRLGTYAAERDPSGAKHSLPPGALVAQRVRDRDPRALTPYGQRVPYVVVEGPTGSSVSSKVHSPHEFLVNRGRFKLCAAYYNRLQCNALSRLLGLAGGNLETWLAVMPKPKARSAHLRVATAASGCLDAQERTMITDFYSSDQCSVRSCAKSGRPRAVASSRPTPLTTRRCAARWCRLAS